MALVVTIENGFAEVGAGSWLTSCGQPAAFFGTAVRRHRKGWVVRDRWALDLVETTDRAWLADAARPFLTYIPCAAPIFAVSHKVLVAPAEARTGSEIVKTVPMSLRGALGVTMFSQKPELENEKQGRGVSAWAVMATASRTLRLQVADEDTLSVRPEAVVAWTGKRPTGFVRRIGVWDILLPRGPRDLMLNFHGPCLVWIEGAGISCKARLAGTYPRFGRRAV